MVTITSVCYFYSFKNILSIDEKIFNFQINNLEVEKCLFALAKQECGLGIFSPPFKRQLQSSAVSGISVLLPLVTQNLGGFCRMPMGHSLSGLAGNENSTMLPLCGKWVVKQTPLQSCTAALSMGALWLGSSDGGPAIEPCNKDKGCK